MEDLRRQVLENQRIIDELNKDLSRKTREVRIIQEIASEVNSSLDLEVILTAILRGMDQVFGFEHSMVLLLDPTEKFLEVAASRGYERAGIGAQVAVGQGVIGTVAKRRKLLRVGGLATQRGYATAVRARMVEVGAAEELSEIPDLPGLAGVQSQVAIPLLLEDRLIGVFAVESTRPSTFDERDEILIGIVANQAASAIHNARLYRDLGQLAATLEERVRARTEDLRRAQAQLVQSEKMAAMGNLVAGVAHELNTPIGAIHSNADVARRAIEIVRKALGEEPLASAVGGNARLGKALSILEETNGVTSDASERVTAIVKSLRNFARLDEAERKRVDLHEGIESTITLLRHELKQRVGVVKNFGPLPEVECFPNRMNQVFMNLLVNSIHAIDGEGTITITTRVEGEWVVLEFRDSGKGIAPDHLARVFDPGFTTKGVGVGTGLGLSITYRIVQDHGGTIAATSEQGEGATFTVRLPLR